MVIFHSYVKLPEGTNNWQYEHVTILKSSKINIIYRRMFCQFIGHVSFGQAVVMKLMGTW